MRLSLLQPKIIRGDIEYNIKAVQRLIDKSKGDLLILPEYVLTGSLVLDSDADIRDWVLRCTKAKAGISLPESRHLLINSLAEFDSRVYNCCELLPGGELQFKLYPDQTELDAGILPGNEQKVFEVSDKRFKVVICFDLRHIERISTDNLDFLLFLYHFTENNLTRVMQEVRNISKTRGLRVLVSSLVSDQNIGYSSFVEGDVVVSLPLQEGILEVEIE